MKSEPREVRREPRLRTGDAEVRHHRKAKPATHRRAMDRADDRLLGTEEAHGLHVERLHGVRLFTRPLAGLVERRAIAEIRAGAEGFTLGGEYDRSAFRVGIEFFERTGDLVDERQIEEIIRGVANFDGDDVAREVHADVLILSHVTIPSKSARAPRG